MDLNIFKNSDASNGLTSSFSDTEKVKEISDKLCEKRRNLELQSSTISSDKLEEYSKSLLELKNDMQLFGISEVDYQIYLTKTSH